MEGKRILVVEDHRPLREAVCRILEKEGYTVLAASDGAGALSLLEKEGCDLSLADIMMPEMDGYELYNAVRARSEWTTIPFIFMTAKAEKEDVLRGKEMGAEDYITKPFDPPDLLVAVRARLARAEEIDRAAKSELEQLKEQIITALGHELRTPLTYVTGYTDLALERAASLPADEIEQFLLGVKQGTARLNRLVEDLLMLIRLDSGRVERECRSLAFVRSDLQEIVERTVRQYAPQARARSVNIETKQEAELPPVRVCEDLFVDALGRLIDNGIKFSPVGGQIRVSTRAAEGWVEIAVADEGPGIAPSEIPHIFERFRQVDRDKMEQQGVGLGLSIAQELVRLHGGEIVVASRRGQGSTFTIRLPVAKNKSVNT